MNIIEKQKPMQGKKVAKMYDMKNGKIHMILPKGVLCTAN